MRLSSRGVTFGIAKHFLAENMMFVRDQTCFRTPYWMHSWEQIFSTIHHMF